MELTRGARWQVEGMAIFMALRAMGNVLGVDLGREVRGRWGTDGDYLRCRAACGDPVQSSRNWGVGLRLPDSRERERLSAPRSSV